MKLLYFRTCIFDLTWRFSGMLTGVSLQYHSLTETANINVCCCKTSWSPVLLYCYRIDSKFEDQQDYKKPVAISTLNCSMKGQGMSMMWCSSGGRVLLPAQDLFFQWLVVSLIQNGTYVMSCLLRHRTDLYISHCHRCTDTHWDTVLENSRIMQSQSAARSARLWWGYNRTVAPVLELSFFSPQVLL